MKDPQQALEKGIQGTVYVSIQINTDGSISKLQSRKVLEEALMMKPSESFA